MLKLLNLYHKIIKIMDHFDDDDRRYRRPRNTTYVGSYRRPGTSRFFNPAGVILESIEGGIDAIDKRKTKVRDFENAAAQRRQEIADTLRETEGMEDSDALNQLQSELSRLVDDAYKLDIASFEGDRSAYNKKASDINNVVQNLTGIMASIHAEGEALKKAEEEGSDFIKKIKRSNNEDYVNFVTDASKGGKNIGFRIEGGNVIAQLNGKDVFNANAYVKAKKDGFDLVNYADDYAEQLATIDKKAFEGLNKYITKESITRIKNGTATTTEKQNYKEAMDLYKSRLEKSDLLTPILNEDTYQMYTNYGTGGDSDSLDPWSNSEMQRAATKQAMLEKLVEQRFPRAIGGEEDDGTITTSTTKKPFVNSQSGKSGKATPTKNYSSIVNKGKELSNFVKNPGDKYFMKGTQFQSVPGGVKNPKTYLPKLEEIKQDLRKQLNDNYALRRLSQKDVIQDFQIAIDENTGEIKAFPMVQKIVKDSQGNESSELVIQRDFGQGIIVNDNNLFKFDKILGGVDPKTTLQVSSASQFNTN
jgi:hypothetical protein